MVMEEDYRQIYFRRARDNPVRRHLVSEFLLMRVQGVDEWVGFRDVFEVDGRQIRDRQDRLASLFLSDTTAALAQARDIAQESSRYNLGSATRTINVPTSTLFYLHPSNIRRSRFEKEDERCGELFAESQGAHPHRIQDEIEPIGVIDDQRPWEWRPSKVIEVAVVHLDEDREEQDREHDACGNHRGGPEMNRIGEPNLPPEAPRHARPEHRLEEPGDRVVPPVVLEEPRVHTQRQDPRPLKLQPALGATPDQRALAGPVRDLANEVVAAPWASGTCSHRA